MAKNSTKDDILQITLMTTGLMSAFFLIWGAYVHYAQIPHELKKRDAQKRNYEKLVTLLTEKESRETLQQQRRKEKIGRESLQGAVADVKKNLGAAGPEIESQRPRSTSAGAGITENTLRVEFREASLEKFIRFIERLESEKPQIEFEKVSINRKGRDKTADSWDAQLTLVSYTSDDEQ